MALAGQLEGVGARGNSVAPDGRLQEPFALLPLGWTLLLLGELGLGLVVSLVRRALHKPVTR
ncbi:DUF3955 domain-containing protein [Burkholderia pseudomallei]|nr:DUF3955 domain-containing protein [Burkholderia pseudomallei]